MAAEFKDRVRYAEKAKVPCRAYWLLQSRYIQQVGDDAPALVQAAPNMPAKVLLPHGKKIQRYRIVEKDGKVSTEMWEHDEHKEDAFLKLLGDEDEPPKKPIEAHLPGKKHEPVKKAHEKHGEPAAKPVV